MQITIEGVNYTLPTSLMAVTLQQRIDFDATYGKALIEQLKKIIDMPDGTEREMEFTAYHLELACKTLAFFAKIPLEIVENTDMTQVLTVYHHTMKNFSEDVDFATKEHEQIREFEWNSETWEIAPPELTNISRMTFGEFITAKQVVQDLMELGNEKWGALLKLSCVYFRKKDEVFEESMMEITGPKYKLMQTLPLELALNVAFFLMRSTDTWINTFLYSGTPEAKEPG